MALSQEQFNQLLLDAEDSTGFGINRYNELKDLGATNEQIAQIAANAPVIGPKAREALPELQDIFYTRIRGELENQYNNIVAIGKAQGKDTTYRGRSSDLPTIFNQQARQLASAGVSSITNLRQGSEDVRTGERFGNVVVGQNPILIDQTTGQKVSTTNLGGSIAIDRDTGAQKFGDIFSGVKGGANYGIQFASDGSPILFPVWEKTKSPIAQVGLEFLEPVIEPIVTAAGYYFGGPVVGTAVGNTFGQYLASGEVDPERVAIATAAAYAGSEIASAGGTEANLANTTGGMTGADYGFQVAQDTTSANLAGTTAGMTGADYGFQVAAEAGAPISTATAVPSGELAFPGREVAANATPVPGSFQEALPGLGVETASSAAPYTAAPGSFQAAVPSLIAPAAAAGSFGVGDALRLANQAQSLFGGQPQMGGLLGGQRGGGQPMGVDYSGLLSLFQSRTATPNVAPLLAPAVNPYQPLLGATNLSLLG